MLKIAYFINEYPAVSHTFIRREILALERQGFEILRISLRGWRRVLPDAEDQSERNRTRYVLKGGLAALVGPTVSTLIRAPVKSLTALRFAWRMSRDAERPLVYHLVYLCEACRLLSWLRRAGITWVHAHFGTNSTEVVMLARILGGPRYSFTIHGPDEFLRNWGLDEKVRRSGFVVAISSFGRSQIYLRCDPGDWPKVEVVHCGLERSFYDLPLSQLPAAPRLVCVGRLSAAKGQLLLLEAAAQLLTEGISVELVLAGDGPMRNQLEQRILQLGLSRLVRITGWISGAQVRDEILAARALVLPSLAEGLPVVIMEAMALRRPTLTTYVAGIPELVQPGQSGWLFPAGSVHDLAQAMKECISMPTEKLQTMGDAAFTRVVKRHDIDTEAARLGNLFRKYAQGSPAVGLNSAGDVSRPIGGQTTPDTPPSAPSP